MTLLEQQRKYSFSFIIIEMIKMRLKREASRCLMLGGEKRNFIEAMGLKTGYTEKDLE
jgi:hypothetical protein